MTYMLHLFLNSILHNIIGQTAYVMDMKALFGSLGPTPQVQHALNFMCGDARG